MPKSLPTLAIPIFVITFFKSTYNCFDCFNKFGTNSEFYIYSIFQIDRSNSIYLRGRTKYTEDSDHKSSKNKLSMESDNENKSENMDYQICDESFLK